MSQGISHDKEHHWVLRIEKLSIFLKTINKHRGNSSTELLVIAVEPKERTKFFLAELENVLTDVQLELREPLDMLANLLVMVENAHAEVHLLNLAPFKHVHHVLEHQQVKVF